MGVQVIGVSFNTPAENAAFKEGQSFPFDLFSDVGKELALYYGAADSVNAFFAKRVTVILDPAGTWILAYPKISGSLYKHAQVVLDDLALLLP